MHPQERQTSLSVLQPGDQVDVSGVVFDAPLLGELLDAVLDSQGVPHFGQSKFNEAEFPNSADFRMARFEDHTSFDRAKFGHSVNLSGCSFGREVTFNQSEFGLYAQFTSAHFGYGVFFADVKFDENARFAGCVFDDTARFIGVVFKNDVWFTGSSFRGFATFNGSEFKELPDFSGIQVEDHLDFSECRFEKTPELGPLLCKGDILFEDTEFLSQVNLKLWAKSVNFTRCNFYETALLEIRYASVTLGSLALSKAVTLKTGTQPLVYGSAEPDSLNERRLVSESDLGNENDCVAKLTSMVGVDASLLVLSDVELDKCVFSGSYNLDQIKMEGDCTFSYPPVSVSPLSLPRWTKRRTITEEHQFRNRTGSPRLRRGWITVPSVESSEPSHVANIYRQLRKSMEDAKNEPGAADFYYGEMEMRRHDHKGTPTGERILLSFYWLLSGYGLRASRALGWLFLSMACSVIALMLWGIPNQTTASQASGSIRGDSVTLTMQESKSQVSGELVSRATAARTEKAIRIVLNSVVFRSSGQHLTTIGSYIEMASRFFEPILLGLGLLAIRGRVKR